SFKFCLCYAGRLPLPRVLLSDDYINRQSGPLCSSFFLFLLYATSCYPSRLEPTQYIFFTFQVIAVSQPLVHVYQVQVLVKSQSRPRLAQSCRRSLEFRLPSRLVPHTVTLRCVLNHST